MKNWSEPTLLSASEIQQSNAVQDHYETDVRVLVKYGSATEQCKRELGGEHGASAAPPRNLAAVLGIYYRLKQYLPAPVPVLRGSAGGFPGLE